MLICIDFDGTVVDHEFPLIGQPVPGAIEWIKKFRDLGAEIILFTMRSDSKDRTVLSSAVEYLKSHGIELFGINTNPTQKEWTSSPKAYAELYIDDAAFGCPLIKLEGFRRDCVDWSVVGPVVESELKNRYGDEGGN